MQIASACQDIGLQLAKTAWRAKEENFFGMRGIEQTNVSPAMLESIHCQDLRHARRAKLAHLQKLLPPCARHARPILTLTEQPAIAPTARLISVMLVSSGTDARQDRHQMEHA